MKLIGDGMRTEDICAQVWLSSLLCNRKSYQSCFNMKNIELRNYCNSEKIPDKWFLWQVTYVFHRTVFKDVTVLHPSLFPPSVLRFGTHYHLYMCKFFWFHFNLPSFIVIIFYYYSWWKQSRCLILLWTVQQQWKRKNATLSWLVPKW